MSILPVFLERTIGLIAGGSPFYSYLWMVICGEVVVKRVVKMVC